jgi:hypothetical protein
MTKRYTTRPLFLAATATSIIAWAPISVEAAGTSGCRLNQPSSLIQHVIYLQFDNIHLERDNLNVPSDLEQIPSLYNFLRAKGTLGSNSHTQLISHTATGIVTTLTGLYPDRTGIGLSNSFTYYKSDGTLKAPFVSTFGYWSKFITGDAPLMVDEKGKTAPAPWVPFTRAGCDVGVVSIANTVLEDGTEVVDMFGASSPEANEPVPQRAKDFVGIAIHCGLSSTS